MSDGIWNALAGAVGQVAVLDAAANNVSNASTPGYRAERAVFREHLVRAGTSKKTSALPSPSSVSIDRIDNDTSPGAVYATGRPLDCAIQGDGFLLVKTPRGDRYTRLGNLHVGLDGTVVTRDGDPVVDRMHHVIKVSPTSTDVAIGSDGTITEGGTAVGQLTTVRFKHPEALEREGALLYKGNKTDPPAYVDPTLQTGSLETSNTSAVKGMVEIINASRGFEACERVIDAFKNADSQAAMSIMKPA
jgi:flagellar basal body rod protein FlgG